MTARVKMPTKSGARAKRKTLVTRRYCTLRVVFYGVMGLVLGLYAVLPNRESFASGHLMPGLYAFLAACEAVRWGQSLVRVRNKGPFEIETTARAEATPATRRLRRRLLIPAIAAVVTLLGVAVTLSFARVPQGEFNRIYWLCSLCIFGPLLAYALLTARRMRPEFAAERAAKKTVGQPAAHDAVAEQPATATGHWWTQSSLRDETAIVRQGRER